MTKQHPIAPPLELIQQWWEGTHGAYYEFEAITVQAAQWGWDQREPELQERADQELEACRQWLEINGAPRKFIDGLLAARRPKPPSLKEQALIGLSRIEQTGEFFSDGMKDLDAIRRALEQLPDDITQ